MSSHKFTPMINSSSSRLPAKISQHRIFHQLLTKPNSLPLTAAEDATMGETTEAEDGMEDDMFRDVNFVGNLDIVFLSAENGSIDRYMEIRFLPQIR